MAVATWEDVAVAVGRPSADFTSDQQAQIAYWLDGVEMFIKSRLGPVDELDHDTVQYVETEVAAEKAQRWLEGGASSVTVTADDGTVTRRYDSVSAADITAELWGLFGSGFGGTAYTVGVSSPLDLP